MCTKNYTDENVCDICGRETDQSRLFLVGVGISPSQSDWKEIVCTDCEETIGRPSGLRMFSLVDLVG